MKWHRALVLATGLGLISCNADTVLVASKSPADALRGFAQPANLQWLGLHGPGAYGTSGTVVNSIRDLKPGWYRLELTWAEVERYANQRNRGYLDEMHTMLNQLEFAGVKAYLVITQSPAFTRGCVPNEDPAFSRDAEWEADDPSVPCRLPRTAPPFPNYMVYWQQFVANMVDEFGPNSLQNGRVTYYGIWNEPNYPGFFPVPHNVDRLAVYNDLVHWAAPEIHARGGKVVGPELAPFSDPGNGGGTPPRSGDQWLIDYMANGAGWTTDVISVHLYTGIGTPDDPTISVKQGATAYLNNGMWQYGNWRFWVTESGPGNAIPSPEQSSFTEDDQARWVVRAYKGFLEYGAENPQSRWDKLFYFNHFERPFDPINPNWDLKLSLMEHDPVSGFLRLKPAYHCYRAIGNRQSPASLQPPSC